MTLFGFPAFGSNLDLMWSNIDLRWDIPLDPTELSHHPVEKEKVVRANLGIRKDVNFWGKIKKDQTHPNPRSTEVNTFEPIEHVHILLQVHLTNLTKSFWNYYLIPSIEFQLSDLYQAAKNNKYCRLSRSKAVDHQRRLFRVSQSATRRRLMMDIIILMMMMMMEMMIMMMMVMEKDHQRWE